MIEIDDKLLKIIELARQGVGGEKDTAIAIVRRRCAELNLDYDDVMAATDEREFMLEVPIKNDIEQKLVAQICLHFALTERHQQLMFNKQARVFFYTTTPSKHVETMNAAIIYLRQWRKERAKLVEDLAIAFVHKHDLFRAFPAAPNAEQPEEMDLEKAIRIKMMAGSMESVDIHKQIESGK